MSYKIQLEKKVDSQRALELIGQLREMGCKWKFAGLLPLTKKAVLEGIVSYYNLDLNGLKDLSVECSGSYHNSVHPFNGLYLNQNSMVTLYWSNESASIDFSYASAEHRSLQIVTPNSYHPNGKKDKIITYSFPAIFVDCVNLKNPQKGYLVRVVENSSSGLIRGYLLEEAKSEILEFRRPDVNGEIMLCSHTDNRGESTFTYRPFNRWLAEEIERRTKSRLSEIISLEERVKDIVRRI